MIPIALGGAGLAEMSGFRKNGQPTAIKGDAHRARASRHLHLTSAAATVPSTRKWIEPHLLETQLFIMTGLLAANLFRMYKFMRIVWDEPKRKANLLKHRLDFADLDLDFLAAAVFRPAHSRRLKALGWLDGMLVISVVFRPLGSEGISVISMRPASAEEREIHDEGF